MEKTAAMRKAEKEYNKLRNRYIGRKVIYTPNRGQEYMAVIRDMSYSPHSFDSVSQEWGCWFADIEYLPFLGAKPLTMCPPVSQLTPDGWTA